MPYRIARWLFPLLIVVMAVAVWTGMQPSNDRQWGMDQRLLPLALMKGDRVMIRDVRTASYRTPTDFDMSTEDRTYDLRELRRVWYVLEPFHGIPGSAHAFLSFEFTSGQYISISVEARKEWDEAYSPIRGLLRQYELMYVIGDEHDLIGLRANIRHDAVFLYPLKIARDQASALFVSMLGSANDLQTHPQFYNTITNNCTTAIASAINDVVPGAIPWSWSLIFPASSDRMLYDRGLIDTTLSFEDAKQHFHINEAAAVAGDDPDFSQKLRAGL